MANPTHYPPGTAAAPGLHPPEPPLNARGETPIETERRWLGNIAAVVLPMFLAGKLLKPKYRTGRPDPLMERVVRIRAWLGLTVVFAVFLRVLYKRDKDATGTLPKTPKAGGLTDPGAIPHPTGLPDASALAHPMATGLPTGLPTNFPTGLPTNFPTNFPTGGLPTNFPTAPGAGIPTSMPTAPGSTPDMSSLGSSGTSTRVQEFKDTLSDVIAAIFHRIVLAPVACALGLVVCGLILVVFARPHVRQHTIRQLVHPIRVILLFALIPVAGFGLYFGLRRVAGLKGKTYLLNTDGSALQLVASWAAAFVAYWTLLFALGALWQITRHLFAAIDGHPMLPALLAIWLAWTLTINDIAFGVGNNMLGGLAAGSDTVPDNVKAAVGILGSTAVTALALWELARLHRWNGINLKSGPWGNQPAPTR
jgi:hypothetical protein